MKTRKVFEGSIFVVRNKLSNGRMSSHHYLMLGSKSTDSDVSLVQAFAITSMRDKKITMEVPVILCNGYVSYIVPYNMHSLHGTDIQHRNYTGCVADCEYITKDAFMQMLKDIYLDSIGMGTKSHDEVMKQYNEYCENFKKYNPDVKEWRNREEEPAPFRKDYPRCYRRGSTFINDKRNMRSRYATAYRFGESHLSHSPRLCDNEQRQYHKTYQDR